MAKYVGVDSCKNGWLAVCLTNNIWDVNLFKDIYTLWEQHRDSSLILIDIPIGLRDGSPRERLCDIEARRLLKARRSSIFPVPCRPAVYSDCKKASEVNRQFTGKRLSKQSLNIICKIRQVDQLFFRYPNARLILKETHPEICFWALCGGKPMRYPKRTKNGFRERVKSLQNIFLNTNNIIKYALSNYGNRELTKDDILDALSAAITAYMCIKNGINYIPKRPELDSRGLQMKIAYHFIKNSYEGINFSRG